jgi:hypothetical protein
LNPTLLSSSEAPRVSMQGILAKASDIDLIGPLYEREF